MYKLEGSLFGTGHKICKSFISSDMAVKERLLDEANYIIQ